MDYGSSFKTAYMINTVFLFFIGGNNTKHFVLPVERNSRGKFSYRWPRHMKGFSIMELEVGIALMCVDSFVIELHFECMTSDIKLALYVKENCF